MTDLISQIASNGNPRVAEHTTAASTLDGATEKTAVSAPTRPVNEAEPVQTGENITDVIERIHEFVHEKHRNLEFTIDEASGHQVIKVIDAETEETIRQFPTDEFLAMSRHIGEFAGLLIDVDT